MHTVPGFVAHNKVVVAASLAATLRSQGFDARPFTDLLKVLSAAISDAPELLISSFAIPMLSTARLMVFRFSRCCCTCLTSRQEGVKKTSLRTERLQVCVANDTKRIRLEKNA